VINGDKFEETEEFKEHLKKYFEFCVKRDRTVRITYFHGDFGDTWLEDGSVPILRQIIKEFVACEHNKISFIGISMNVAAVISMRDWQTAFLYDDIEANYFNSLVEAFKKPAIKQDPEFIESFIRVLSNEEK